MNCLFFIDSKGNEEVMAVFTNKKAFEICKADIEAYALKEGFSVSTRVDSDVRIDCSEVITAFVEEGEYMRWMAESIGVFRGLDFYKKATLSLDNFLLKSGSFLTENISYSKEMLR